MFFLLAALPAVASGPEDPGWAEILRLRVNAAGEVSYRKLATFDGDRIQRTVKSVAAVDPERMDRDDRVAFWINAYNAAVVYAVLWGESPETLSSRARMFHWFRVEIAGAGRTLDDVHGILARYASLDPRIHFALCDGTRGGPRLALQPYRGSELDAELASAVREFVNDPGRNRFDSDRRRVDLSRIFDWYRSDFERTGGSLTGYLRDWLRDPKSAALMTAKDLSVGFLDVDWTLNAAPGERPR